MSLLIDLVMIHVKIWAPGRSDSTLQIRLGGPNELLQLTGFPCSDFDNLGKVVLHGIEIGMGVGIERAGAEFCVRVRA